jgi:hypothetical protein
MGIPRRFLMRGLLPGLTVLLLAGTPACEPERVDELPEGWAGAEPISIKQGTCPSGFAPVRGNARLDLTKNDMGLHGIYRDATFRCDDQKICGFVNELDPTTRVLMQPCEMRPSVVARCSCHYEITFSLPARAGRMTLELYRRSDLHGAQGPVAPGLVDTERVP